MKALVLYGKDGQYGYEENWPEPELRPGWVIVRVAQCGICGSDLPRLSSMGSYRHPMILGHEFSGTVERANAGSAWEPGTRVAILPIIPCGGCRWCNQGEPFLCENRYQFIGSRNDGGFAEFCAVPENNLFRLPDSTDISEGSLIEPMLVALNTVRRSGFRAGQTAIVFGAGPIGLLTACWLRVFGASRVTVSDLRRFSLELAGRCGFDDLYDSSLEDDGVYTGYDHAFEAAGSGKALLSAVERLNVRGTLTVVGRDVRDTVIPVGDFEKIMRRGITLKGCWGYKSAGEEAFLYKVLKESRIPLGRLITHRVPVRDAAGMIADMVERKLDYCKVVIDFTL